MSPQQAAGVIHDAYVAGSQVVSVEAAETVRGDWDLLCGRVTAMTAEHSAAIGRLMAERDQAIDQASTLRKQLAGPLAEFNRILGGQTP